MHERNGGDVITLEALLLRKQDAHQLVHVHANIEHASLVQRDCVSSHMQVVANSIVFHLGNIISWSFTYLWFLSRTELPEFFE